ncbi:MAG TPA: glycerol-3-phosphate dehydrogenase/oxidase [Acidimicrobiales bacterium]|jgi:glycerol-3-phosphate dehydrogenase|nr:glycerol-3-phosphate dehydrogenase/oxidase [Acidimicrobiales bacterium]
MGDGFDRATNLRRLVDEQFDVLVVGGGITGAGVALDAASRGLRTALIERDDFASGTSSKSSKLVHGGLRYLQNGDVRLVYEALAERQRLRKNAPHLVKILPFLIPIFSKDGLINPKIARAMGSAMWMYDLTGGARIGKLHKRLRKDDAVAYMPTLPVERLAGAYLYYDAQADDARLTLTIARTAALEFDAVVANGCAVTAFSKDANGRLDGATVAADGHSFTVRAASVVNATGVWADDVRALDEGHHPDSIRPAKGIHITVPWSKVQNKIAVVVPVPKDKRSVFVVPWGGTGGNYQFTYIGTTDTDYLGSLDDPQCTADDIAYLLRAINFSVITKITEADILGTWAGLRPLVKSATSGRTADLSRRHRVARSASGMVSITGGKLTTYREMAADTVDEVVKVLGRDATSSIARHSRTKRLHLRGADGYEAALAAAASDAVLAHLLERYGDEARSVLALADGDATLRAPLVSGLPYVRAEAVYAARHEMARSIDDVLSRRTRARLLGRDAASAAAADVAALLGAELGWDAGMQAAQVTRYQELASQERDAAHLPETALEAAIGS